MPQYQGVWTLEAQAQAQSNQQWVTDPNFKNTTLLLQADGTGSGSQNNTFLDGSTNNFFITRNGNTTQGSFSPFSQALGYWSNYLQGSSSGFSFTGINIGTSQFTFEGWVYVPSFGSIQHMYGGSSASDIAIEITNATTIVVDQSGVASQSFTVPAMATNAWHHIAVVRNASVMTAFVDGVRSSTGTLANTVNYNNFVYIGYKSSGFALTGYVSNFRVVKAAVYDPTQTTIVVPDSPLTSIANTVLLTCQSNRFVDNGPNAVVLTPTNSPSVQAFGPFAPALQWTPDVVGGSGYFDGSGDYLSGSSSANLDFGTGDFTVEMFVYVIAYPGSSISIFAGGGSGGGSNINLYVGTNGYVGATFDGVGEDAATAAGAIKTGNWQHVALVRSGNNFTIYINGVSAATGSTANASTFYGGSGWFIGANGAGSNQYLNGYVSSVRVLKGTALYTTTFTPPTTPPTAIANTQLLINSTNAGIYDGKMGNVFETKGNAQVATSPVKFGSGSMYFDGTGTYPSYATSNLVGPANAGFYNFGTSNFTIEAWINLSVTTTARAIVSSGYNADTGGGGWTFTYRGDISSLSLSVNANVVYSKSWSPSANIWYHVAVTRAENILRFFVDGVQIGTTSTSTDNITGSSTIVVGGNSGGTNLNFFGYIDDLRITRVARYIANFTPPQQALPRQ
jgi:hypothetical protein